MRVIAGKARRLPLKTVPGLEARPTTDRIKETLFNMLHNELQGVNFLDLFSGSGGIGIEALSRGADFVVFVDNNPKAVDCITENLNFTRLNNQGKVMRKDAITAIKELNDSGLLFEFVFMDPPYGNGFEQKVFQELSQSSIISKDTIIIVETQLNEDFSYLEKIGFEIKKEKLYKTNKHTFICLRQEDL